MSANLTQEIAAQAAQLPLKQQRELLRIAENMARGDTPETVVLPATTSVEAERKRILEDLLARMKANPIPASAPPFTREELHERC